MPQRQHYSVQRNSDTLAQVQSLKQPVSTFHFTRSRNTLLFLLAGIVAGCSGGGGAAAVTPGVDTQSVLAQSVLTQSAFGKGHELVYVANETANSITAYASTASGNARPILTIAGSNTHLDQPVGLTFDSSGNLYVVNHGLQQSNITIYCRGASGNVAPMGTIEGPQTHLRAVSGPADYPTGAIAVDSKNGHIFVGRVSHEQSPLPNNVLVFNLNARGNAAPISSIGSPNSQIQNLVNPTDPALYFTQPAPAIALDSIGAAPQILAGTEYFGCCKEGDGWTDYAASDLTPTGGLTYYANDGLNGLAVTPGSGNIVASYNREIDVWPAGSGGVYGGQYGNVSPPLRILQAGAGDALAAVAVDSRQKIWALVFGSNVPSLPVLGLNQIDVYAPNATTPVVISGSATGLSGPSGIAVLP